MFIFFRVSWAKNILSYEWIEILGGVWWTECLNTIFSLLLNRNIFLLMILLESMTNHFEYIFLNDEKHG